MPFDRPQLYNQRTSQQVIEGTNRIQTQYYGSSEQRPLWNRPVVTAGGTYKALVTTAITPCISSGGIETAGQGNGTIQIWTLSGGVYTAGADPSFTAGMLILNWYVNSGTIPTGVHVYITFVNGIAELLTADCPTS
jgi:hypothetical protein